MATCNCSLLVILLGACLSAPSQAAGTEKTIQFADGSFYRFPELRWSFSNMRELIPSKNVSRGIEPVCPLPRRERSLDNVTFADSDEYVMTWAQALAQTNTDGVLVMHRGAIVYEKYFGALEPSKPHLAFSIAKSLLGTAAAMLAFEGKLDLETPVTQHVPELAGTAYDKATIRDLLDMTVSAKYSENYANPKADFWDYLRAGSFLPTDPDYRGARTFYEYLGQLRQEGDHGEIFAYNSVNTEALAWIVKRVTDQSSATLLSQTVWSKLGTEHDAYFLLDRAGVEFSGGGFNATLRDLARFGEMMRLNGRYCDHQIIPSAVVADIRRGGNRDVFAKAGYKTMPGGSYHNMWWVLHNEHGAFMGNGIHGQHLYIDPKAEMVIVQFASLPTPANSMALRRLLAAYAAIAAYLITR
jgi:CubicO group peptidase (beta-lactamase class C family)